MPPSAANQLPSFSFVGLKFGIDNCFDMQQFRLMSNADDLEAVFERQLKSVKYMVALLDTWERPQYCTRIWTVFEQYTAAKLGVEVQMILPPAQMESFQAAMQSGGVSAVTQNLTQIDVENAKASFLEDGVKVRALIQQHASVDKVNKAVTDSMSKWCGQAFTEFLQSGQVACFIFKGRLLTCGCVQACGSPGEPALSLEDKVAMLENKIAMLENKNTVLENKLYWQAVQAAQYKAEAKQKDKVRDKYKDKLTQRNTKVAQYKDEVAQYKDQDAQLATENEMLKKELNAQLKEENAQPKAANQTTALATNSESELRHEPCFPSMDTNGNAVVEMDEMQ